MCVVNKICKTCWRLKLIRGKKGPFCAVHYNNVKLHAFLREVVAAASASLQVYATVTQEIERLGFLQPLYHNPYAYIFFLFFPNPSTIPTRLSDQTHVKVIKAKSPSLITIGGQDGIFSGDCCQ